MQIVFTDYQIGKLLHKKSLLKNCGIVPRTTVSAPGQR